MDSNLSDQSLNPKRLKTLAFNVKCSKGNNLLHQFVLDNSDPNHSGSEKYINAVLLSMSDASVNALNNEGCSALHLAVRKNNLLMVKKLLTCLVNIDINTEISYESKRNTALHIAASWGHLPIILELLNKGASIDKKNGDGITALCFAADSGDLDIIKLLVSKGANVNLISGWGYPLHCAARSGNVEAVKFLVSNGANLSAIGTDGDTVLHEAAQSGNLATVEILVSNGADVNAKNKIGSTPLYYGAKSGDLATVDFLVSRTDLDATDGLNILLRAARSGSLNIIKLLLDTGINADIKSESGRRLLAHAAYSGDLETIKFLIEKGADVNTIDTEEGYTPLHLVLHTNNSNLAAVEYLVNNGADVNAKGERSKTPLHAATYRNLEIVEFLVGKGADLHAIDKYGQTPFYMAIYWGNLEIAEVFVKPRC